MGCVFASLPGSTLRLKGSRGPFEAGVCESQLGGVGRERGGRRGRGKGGHERGCELKTVANGKPAPVNPTPEEFVLRRLSSSTVIRSGILTGRKGSDWDGRSAFRSCDSKSFNS